MRANDIGWGNPPDSKMKIRQAFRNYTEAAMLRAEAETRNSPSSSSLLDEAENIEDETERMLELNEPAQNLVGGEMVVPEGCDREVALSQALELRSQPMVAARASQERLTLAEGADVLILAADAADGIPNPTSLEKMLAHQLAAAHRLSMKLFAQADRVGENFKSQLDLNHASHLIGQAARLMKTFQTGLQTLMKAKNGGRQEVVVQHVHVGKDGQAVVAGKMDYPARGGGRPPRRGDK
ncbi:MAG: hypothetical protein GX442_00395 [Candidatus Riflebacteria bacterium]|nr:hypothetical protein [Candidatus Riflebacteria bacterium]